jgi:NAD(P)-dependent dehydrogenase (short-subunit alcohol dehydrogenase family)
VVHGIALCGACVVMGCVTREEGEAAKERLLRRCTAHTLEVYPLDLRDSLSIRAFAVAMTGRRIAALVNCAGVCGHYFSMLHVNFLGPARLVLELEPHLLADARIVFVGSDAHQIGHVDLADFWLEKRFAGVNPAVSTLIPVQQAYGTTKLMVHTRT